MEKNDFSMKFLESIKGRIDSLQGRVTTAQMLEDSRAYADMIWRKIYSGEIDTQEDLLNWINKGSEMNLDPEIIVSQLICRKTVGTPE